MATRQIYGTIAPDGNVMSGAGIQCRKIKEGTYIVEFEQPFGREPAPVCTVYGHEWMTFNLSVAIVEVTPQYFICVTSSPDRPTDCAFQFIVVGDE
jgi:hypothetical protein